MTHHHGPTAGMSGPEDPMEPEEHVCGVCGRALDFARDLDTGETAYVHAARDRPTDDHPVVPVKRGEVPSLDRCDVCLADGPVWRLPTRPFTTPRGESTSADWLLCAECGKRVERNDWNGLTRRGITAAEERHGIEFKDWAREEMKGLYRQVRKNVTGALRPFP
ncbi:hypothetical protein [Nocardioides pakistanensis]